MTCVACHQLYWPSFPKITLIIISVYVGSKYQWEVNYLGDLNRIYLFGVSFQKLFYLIAAWYAVKCQWLTRQVIWTQIYNLLKRLKLDGIGIINQDRCNQTYQINIFKKQIIRRTSFHNFFSAFFNTQTYSYQER